MAKNKDPAVLFYTSDFLTGVSDLTMEERGQYITLLCLQHQKGHLSSKTIKANVVKVSQDVLAKFVQDSNGDYYNERMECESIKRKKYSESRRNNVSARYKKDTYEEAHKTAYEDTYEDTYVKDMKPHMKLHMENENENENIYKNNTDTVSFSFSNTTTTTTHLPLSAYAQDESEEYAIFTLEVMEYFTKNGYTSNSTDFIAYNENRGWRGIGGEDVKADFQRYADQWEEIQKLKNERFTR